MRLPTWIAGLRPQPASGTADALHWRDLPKQYAASDLVLVIGGGIAVFAVTGYLGYSDQPKVVLSVFRPPALMYLWLCFILLLIMARHPLLRGRALVPVAAFLFAVFLVALYYLDQDVLSGHPITTALTNFMPNVWRNVTDGRFLANLLNFGVLLWYGVAVGASWWQRYGPGAEKNTMTRPEESVASLSALSSWRSLQNAIHGELISGDLLAGAAIAGLFALLFSQPVFSALQLLVPKTAPAPPHANPPCAITLLGSGCSTTGLAMQPYVTLTYVDVRVAFVLAALGGLVLATESAIKAFRSAAIERVFVEFARTLLSALGRLITVRILGLVNALWLPLILLAPVAGALAAQYIQCDLHQLGGDKAPSSRCDLTNLTRFGTQNPNVALAVAALVLLALVLVSISLVPRHRGGPPLELVRQMSGLLVFVLALTVVLVIVLSKQLVLFNRINLSLSLDDRYALLAVALLLIAMLALIWGIGLWLERWDAIAQSLIFLAFFSWIVLILFWFFSFVLAGADHLFNTPGVHRPFQVNDAALWSLGTFVATAIYVGARYRFGRRPPQAAGTPGRDAPRGPSSVAVAPPADGMAAST